MPNEIELKLRIDEEDVARLRQHPMLRKHAIEKAVTRRLVSTYYDTPDLKLLDAAVSLRVRHMEGGWFQAVKGAGHSLAGLHQRMEWEDLLSSGEPDFSKLTEPSLVTLFADKNLRDALSPIFVTDVYRTEWQLEYAGSAIEAALDLGELRPGQADASRPTEKIHELELELKHGEARHVFELALALLADIPLHIENISKAQRGYAYYRPAPPTLLPPAQPVGLPVEITEQQAYRHITGQALQQLQNGQEVFLLTESQASVASMQTALRHLTFACKYFSPRPNKVREDLNWVASRLDALHEWNIFRDETLPALQDSVLQSAEINLLLQHAGIMQERASMKLRSRLNNQRYQRMLLKLGASLTDEKTTGKLALQRLEHSLEQNHKKLKKQGLLPQEPGHKNLYKLCARIDHLCQAIALMPPPGKAQAEVRGRYAERLTNLQNALTALQATALCQAFIARLQRRADSNVEAALDKLRPWNRQRLDKTRNELDTALQALLDEHVDRL